MEVVTMLSSKGQLTVPKTVRRTLGIDQGDRVEFTVEKGQVRMRASKRARSSSGVLHSFLRPAQKVPTVAEMDEAIARHFARKHRDR